MWIRHRWMLYNLDKIHQIAFGDEYEIVLTTHETSEAWDESKCISLTFSNKEERDRAFESLNVWLRACKLN